MNGLAVLVVTCARAIVVATPVVALAGAGRGARQGLLVKGRVALERPARVDTAVGDKTGAATSGEPHPTDVVPLNGLGEADCCVPAGGRGPG